MTVRIQLLDSPLRASELTRRLLLLAIFLPEWRDSKIEDHLRRVQRARDHGVGMEAYSTFAETRRPPGLYPPYSSPKSGRATPDPEPKAELVETPDGKVVVGKRIGWFSRRYQET